MADLAGRVAVVAGATRGAGRGIARALGEAGATVYCTGRSVRGKPSPYARRETIEETAELVDRAGGKGIAVRVDHQVEAEVQALFARVGREQKRLDILVNDISEGVHDEWGQSYWKVDLEKWNALLRQGVLTHMITAKHAAPLMIRRRRGLIVEIGDGDTLCYRGTIFYDLIKVIVMRLAFVMAWELRKHRVAAVAVTPGFLRSEMMLDHFKVTEENWRAAGRKDRHFLASETPLFVGRAIAALAADPKVFQWTGQTTSSWELARRYRVVDADGCRPDWGRHFMTEIPARHFAKAWMRKSLEWQDGIARRTRRYLRKGKE
jgi:NAD(P)-dependent dehydrogenase (short-subunit alcohol dehydrogenase family)